MTEQLNNNNNAPKERSFSQKINRKTQALSDTFDQLDLIDISGHFTEKQWISVDFQMHTEHSPG